MPQYPWKHAWITGASSGIGRDLAIALAETGVTVSISARSDAELETLTHEYERLSAYPLDVTDPKQVETAVAAIEAAHGPIDLAVLNAGFWKLSDAEQLEFAAFRRSIDVNYLGVAAALAPLTVSMRARGQGHIAIVSSVAGYRGLPRSAYYGPTKAALINLCESLQPELAGNGIRLQVINPGFVSTPMTEQNDFPMPFLIDTAEAVRQILKGLTSRRFEIAFPWQFAAILKIGRLMPNRLYLWMIRKFVASA